LVDIVFGEVVAEAKQSVAERQEIPSVSAPAAEPQSQEEVAALLARELENLKESLGEEAQE
jgi:hypothetical protein